MINLDKIRDSINQDEYTSGCQQTMKFVGNAAKNLGIN